MNAISSSLAARGLVLSPLASDEEPHVVIAQIEALVHAFTRDLLEGHVDGAFTMIRRTAGNTNEDPISGALLLGEQVIQRKFNARNAGKVAQMLQVFDVVHSLLQRGKRISQRELFYLLIDSFKDQQQLNNTVLDVSATLGVPRFALNIGAATRGVLAGCLRLAMAGSLYQVDCEYVGSVRHYYHSLQLLMKSLGKRQLANTRLNVKHEFCHSNRTDGRFPATYAWQTLLSYIRQRDTFWVSRQTRAFVDEIQVKLLTVSLRYENEFHVVIEKFGIFTRLVQDRIFEKLPLVLICGKGYPSVSTRAVTSLLANRLRYVLEFAHNLD